MKERRLEDETMINFILAGCRVPASDGRSAKQIIRNCLHGGMGHNIMSRSLLCKNRLHSFSLWSSYVGMNNMNLTVARLLPIHFYSLLKGHAISQIEAPNLHRLREDISTAV